jgi:hypothetical protein
MASGLSPVEEEEEEEEEEEKERSMTPAMMAADGTRGSRSCAVCSCAATSAPMHSSEHRSNTRSRDLDGAAAAERRAGKRRRVRRSASGPTTVKALLRGGTVQRRSVAAAAERREESIVRSFSPEMASSRFILLLPLNHLLFLSVTPPSLAASFASWKENIICVSWSSFLFDAREREL